MLPIKCDQRPNYLLLENVDRLLKSPSRQRGRDFADISRHHFIGGLAVSNLVLSKSFIASPILSRDKIPKTGKSGYFSNSPEGGRDERTHEGITGKIQLEKNITTDI